MTPGHGFGDDPPDPDDLLDRLDALEDEAVPDAVDMTPAEWAAAYEAGEVDIPDGALPATEDRAIVGPTDPDAGDDEWVYLRLFGDADENIGGIRAPRAAIPDCFDPDEDFPV